MSNGKRYGPGERLSSRPGGDMASDEDDVQGHVLTRATGDPEAPTGRIEPMGVNTKGLKASDDDDVEGHGLKTVPRADDEQDTEGHAGTRRAIRASDDDDTEGHRAGRHIRASDDDDTEGHNLNRAR